MKGLKGLMKGYYQGILNGLTCAKLLKVIMNGERRL